MAETQDDAEEVDRGSDHEDCMSDVGVACAASDNEPSSDKETLPPACLYKYFRDDGLTCGVPP